jgi:transposase-like protein
MGKGIRYSDKLNQEAVNQVVIQGYRVEEVSARLGISIKSLCSWKKFSKPARQRLEEHGLQAENAQLKRELKWAQQAMFDYIEMLYNPNLGTPAMVGCDPLRITF